MSQDQARFYRPRPVTDTKRSEDLDDGQSANQRPSTRNPTRIDSTERCESRLRRRDARESAGSRRVRQSRTGDSTPSRLELGNDLATLVACDDASAMSPTGRSQTDSCSWRDHRQRGRVRPSLSASQRPAATDRRTSLYAQRRQPRVDPREARSRLGERVSVSRGSARPEARSGTGG